MWNPFSMDALDDVRHDTRWSFRNPREARAVTWSLIAAYADGFCFNYGYLVRFLQERNETCGWGSDPQYFHPAPIPSPLEFLEILKFREDQLIRAIDNPAAKWTWPPNWGDVSWNAPVVSGVWAADGSKLWNLSHEDLAKLNLVETRNGIMAHEHSVGPVSPAAADSLLGRSGDRLRALLKPLLWYFILTHAALLVFVIWAVLDRP